MEGSWMTEETALAILEAADEIGLEMKKYDGYSGRGMYGSDTTGIVFESENDLLAAVSIAALRLSETERDVEGFVDDVRKFRRDNMGKVSMIVY